MQLPREFAQSYKEESEGKLQDQGQGSCYVKHTPLEETLMTEIADANVLLSRDPIPWRELSEPLLDEHRQGRSDETEDQASEPEGVDPDSRRSGFEDDRIWG